MTKFKILLVMLFILVPLILVLIARSPGLTIPQVLKTAPSPSPSAPDSLPPNVFIFTGTLIDIEKIDKQTTSITLTFADGNEDYILAEGITIGKFRKGQKVTITVDLAKDVVTAIKAGGP